MSEQAIGVTARQFPVRAALPWLVGIGVYALLWLLGPQLLNDPDTYSHIAIGRWTIAHGTVPAVDSFSFSVPGVPFVSFEWLSQVIYAHVYALAGWNGVVVLAATLAALAIGLLTHYLLRELSATLTLLMVVAAFVLTAPHLLARPHVLMLPLMVVWAAALVRCMDRKTLPPYWALPLLILWANLHGSTVLAIGLIGPVVLEALIESKRSEWLAIIRRWLPFGLLAIAACCLTPYGPEPLLMPLTTLGLGEALNWIAEWRPQDFSRIGAFELLLLAGIFALSRGMTLPVVRTLVVLGLLHFALAQMRNADLLAMLAPLYLAAPLARQFGTGGDGDATTPARAIIPAALGVMIVAATLTISRDLRPSPRNTPDAAVAAADLTHAGPVLNDYAFGGYLIFNGIPTFIDGRAEIYGGRFIARYNNALALTDLNDFLALLDQYKIKATLLEPRTPAIALLDRLPEWHRVYGDGVAVVHKRREASKD